MTNENKKQGCDRCGGMLFVAEAGPKREDLCRACYLGFNYIIDQTDCANQDIHGRRCRIVADADQKDGLYLIEVLEPTRFYTRIAAECLKKVGG